MAIKATPQEVWRAFEKTTPNALAHACRELHAADQNPKEYPRYPEKGVIIGYGAALRRAGYDMSDAMDLMVRQVRKEATAFVANRAEVVLDSQTE